MQENSETFYHNLPNGVRVVVRKTDSPVVYVGVMVGAGTRDEQPAENGMAHYIEHCVFKGTEKHTARQIINSIEGIGGEINAYTTKEETTFYAATLPEHTTRTLRLLAEMVLRPTFPKHETDKELGVIFDEIESYNDSPSELIYDDFEGMLFEGHSLAMPILGTKKTLRKISASPANPQQWMRLHYRPERMVVFCQGNIAPDIFFRLAEREFGETAQGGAVSMPHRFGKTAQGGAVSRPHQVAQDVASFSIRLPRPACGEGDRGRGTQDANLSCRHQDIQGGAVSRPHQIAQDVASFSIRLPRPACG
ncbi:MAG: M16 family metallopeptidase, partial [Paludibacteraceae bacterium]